MAAVVDLSSTSSPARILPGVKRVGLKSTQFFRWQLTAHPISTSYVFNGCLDIAGTADFFSLPLPFGRCNAPGINSAEDTKLWITECGTHEMSWQQV